MGRLQGSNGRGTARAAEAHRVRCISALRFGEVKLDKQNVETLSDRVGNPLKRLDTRHVIPAFKPGYHRSRHTKKSRKLDLGHAVLHSIANQFAGTRLGGLIASATFTVLGVLSAAGSTTGMARSDRGVLSAGSDCFCHDFINLAKLLSPC
jgi:hypothetical protein